MMRHRAALGLGSNVGDRLANLYSAVRALDAHPDIEVEATSGIYETEPVSPVPQAAYLNAVVVVRTRLAPHPLLRAVQDIERAHGRDRSQEVRWGPRPLDIDILLYDDERIDSDGLVVPHPRMAERPFVLIPLLEVAPGATMPDGTRVASLLRRLAPISGVELVVRPTDLPGAPAPRPPGPAGPGVFTADEWRAR